MKLVYEDLLERAKEKEEKEAKRRQRLADDFSGLLHTFKVFRMLMTYESVFGWLFSLPESWPSMVVFMIQEITNSSNWEDSKHLFEESEEYR